jgi:hypothetical protein
MNKNNSTIAAWGAMDTVLSHDEMDPFYTKTKTTSGSTSTSGTTSNSKLGYH